MFCNKCGKPIDDKSTFCSWCGAHVEAPVPQTAPAAEPTEKEPSTTAEPVTSAGSAVSGQEAPSVAAPHFGAAGTAFPGAAAAKPEENSVPTGVPRPVETAKSGWSTEVPIIDKPRKPEKPAKPRKYYTGAHLALCLVTTGIMAMAAGVFAALYFMTIL